MQREHIRQNRNSGRVGAVMRNAAFGALLLASFGSSAQLVSQSPLQVGSNVPGNLAIVGSLEFPTMVSVGNLGDGVNKDIFNSTKTYVGYFDSGKCYAYQYSATESERYFYPVNTSGPNCSGTNWSGNYLNWATTQSIDAFRKALTGGYRVKDTTTETWLEKAWQDGQGSITNYPNREITNATAGTVGNATPVTWSSFKTRILGLGNQMFFTNTGTLGTATNPASGISPTPVIAYDPGGAALDQSKIYAVSIRVKVCDSTVGVESNCVQYGSNWKPEGLIQQNAESIRFSAFGYLGDGRRYNTGTDALTTRDGGVMRARAKFVGPTLGPTNTVNPNREWDGTTGVFIQNPDPADATATETATGQTVTHSGVINFLNKTGQIVSDALYKRYDPVSELYYSAIRYFKNQGYIPEHATVSGDATKMRQLVDGLPVITNWDDPIQHWCQKNVILGIGDTNTSADKNLPGNTSGTGEPSKPSAVSSDTTVDVIAATDKIAALEGISIAHINFGGGSNRSAFIAGLAYDSNTKDIRPELDADGNEVLIGKQTISTYWVDIQEFSTLKTKANNQYWLATKYGGFTVPQNFDPYTHSTALPSSWWNKSGETLSTGDPRPDTFYTAAEADQMIASLTRAFTDISQAQIGSGASLAANSTKLDAGTVTFQAQFFSDSWRGELNAFDVDPNTGALSNSPTWQAGANVPAFASRQIYFHNPQGSNAGQKYRLFTWANLGSNQATALESQNIVDYLRGDRSNEEPAGVLRTRTGVIGDIVHSQPVFVGKPNDRLHAGATFTGASDYPAFVAAQATRSPSVVYVGANDGMLHGFNAATGAETYAFIPNQVIVNGLKDYSTPGYQHKFFVDGEMTVADVYFTGGGAAWKTILIGTLGRGGPGIFALDVTDPNSVEFLWEKNATDIPALGKNIGKPIIAQVANGDWRVILGNGADSSGQNAQLVMINIQGGNVTTVDTGVGSNNGLSAVFTWDSDADGFIDTAYAGDLKGNLWRFTGLGGTPAFGKLFEAVDSGSPAQAQPITAAPLVGRNPDTAERWVFFGTGKFLNELDQADQQVQSWYGIIDSGTLVAKSDLVARSILAEGTINGFGARVIQAATAGEFTGKKGWYMDLVSPVNGAEGERMVVPNQFQGNVLIGTSRIPDASDVCQPTGRGFVMAIDPFTGARLDRTFFDVTLDSVFNDADKLLVNGVLTIVSGIGFSSSPNQPIFIENVMQVGLDDGSTKTVQTQGTAADARRTSWREVLGN